MIGGGIPISRRRECEQESLGSGGDGNHGSKVYRMLQYVNETNHLQTAWESVSLSAAVFFAGVVGSFEFEFVFWLSLGWGL